MEQLNRIEVETRGGNRTFELLCGDIVDLDSGVDLLVVSVQGHNYYPEPGSVIGTLHTQLAIDIARMAEKPDLDFRGALNCWVARSPERKRFRHILCIEVYGARSPEQVIKNLFSNVFAAIAALESKGYKLRTIAMPLLATRRGDLDVEMVMRAMLDHSLRALEGSRVLRTVQFVVRDEDHALKFSFAMDKVLGRSQVRMPQGAAIRAVRRKIADRIGTVVHMTDTTDSTVFSELRKAILSDESQPFVLGLAARKVIEFLIKDMVAGKKYKDINSALKQLEEQKDEGPALWILYYMEVIRTLGNDSSHMSNSQRHPSSPTQADLELLLMCLLRVLDFWIEHKRAGAKQQNQQGVLLIEETESTPTLVNDLLPT